jgi:hypothetical protein
MQHVLDPHVCLTSEILTATKAVLVLTDEYVAGAECPFVVEIVDLLRFSDRGRRDGYEALQQPTCLRRAMERDLSETPIDCIRESGKLR